MPDLTPIMPFLCYVAAYDMARVLTDKMRTINTLSFRFRSDPNLKCLQHVNQPQPTAPIPCSARGVADVLWGALPAGRVHVWEAKEICHFAPRAGASHHCTRRRRRPRQSDPLAQPYGRARGGGPVVSARRS